MELQKLTERFYENGRTILVSNGLCDALLTAEINAVQ